MKALVRRLRRSLAAPLILLVAAFIAVPMTPRSPRRAWEGLSGAFVAGRAIALYGLPAGS